MTSPERKSQNSNMLLAFLTLVGVIALVALVGFLTLKKGPEIIQGQAETTEYRVSSKVPGRILCLLVKEGDKVKKGDTLAILEAPDVEAKMAQAKAAEAMAQAQNEKALKGARSEQIQAAYEMWQKAKAGREIAEKSHQRVNRLYQQGVMTAQKNDEATAQYNAAIATEKAAKAQYDMARNGAEREDKMAAAALVERAKGAVAEVESYIHETFLTALADGEVAEIFPQKGELVGTGAPIMNIAELNNMWVTFNVRDGSHCPSTRQQDYPPAHLLHEGPRHLRRMESHEDHRTVRPEDLRGKSNARRTRPRPAPRHVGHHETTISRASCSTGKHTNA